MGQRVRITQITDGTSNTLMAAEVIQGRQGDIRGYTWWGGASGFTSYLAPNSSQQDVLTGGSCVSLVTPLMPCTTTSTNTAPRMLAARSLHTPGGVNTSMCDGSVRFIANSVGTTVWQALSTSQGGEVFSLAP